MRVERVETTKRAALERAYAALVRQLEDEIKRRRDLGRRPKKYVAARRASV